MSSEILPPFTFDRWVWRLEGPPGPTVALTLRVGEAARAAAMRVQQARAGTVRLPVCLHGPSADSSHAFWQAEDRDGDGCIDHLAVRVPMGLCAEGAAILQGLAGLRVDGVGRWRLVAVETTETAGTDWVSAVPFVAPLNAFDRQRRLRPGLDAAGQLAASLARCPWLPPVAGITPLPGEAEPLRLGARRGRGAAYPLQGRFHLRFAAPTAGPVAVGYGAHFGLGRFVCMAGGWISAEPLDSTGFF